MTIAKSARVRLFGFTACTGLLLLSIAASAAQFTADIVTTAPKIEMERGSIKVGKMATTKHQLYIKDGKSHEVRKSPNEIHRVVNGKKLWMWAAGKDRTYQERLMPASMEYKAPTKGLLPGTEKIQGYVCQKSRTTQSMPVPINGKQQNEQFTNTIWWSKDLSYPLKSIVECPKAKLRFVTEVSNIRKVAIPDSMFMPPKGYKKAASARPQMPTGMGRRH